MNSWVWIGLLGIVVFTLVPFIDRKERTREKTQKAVLTLVSISIIIVMVFLGVNFIVALVIGGMIRILLDVKTYTKKRLLIHGGIALCLAVFSYMIFRSNPDYIIKHAKEHPESTSLYLAANGEELLAYEASTKRPLASVVKILIALEYAMQIEEKQLQKDTLVPLDELAKYYLKNSDGGAHEAWLYELQQQGRIEGNQVALHEVAKGMITYSSNANTDYLIDLLGADAINARKAQLGLAQHEDVYPIVGALYIAQAVQRDELSEAELIEQLESMPLEDYKALAHEMSDKMKTQQLDIKSEELELSIKLQKVWSDRFTSAAAREYGQLLQLISNDELPAEAAKIMRDLMEWPMEFNKDNQELYAHVGSKGGSTMFVLNNALYTEDLTGQKLELVYLMDQLNVMERFFLERNRHSFEAKLVNDASYREKVMQELTAPF